MLRTILIGSATNYHLGKFYTGKLTQKNVFLRILNINHILLSIIFVIHVTLYSHFSSVSSFLKFSLET